MELTGANGGPIASTVAVLEQSILTRVKAMTDEELELKIAELEAERDWLEKRQATLDEQPALCSPESNGNGRLRLAGPLTGEADEAESVESA